MNNTNLLSGKLFVIFIVSVILLISVNLQSMQKFYFPKYMQYVISLINNYLMITFLCMYVKI